MDIGPVRVSDFNVYAGVQQVSPKQINSERRELIQAVKAVNRAELFGDNTEVTFSDDRETRRPVTKIVDKETGEVIRQIPPEYILHLAKNLQEK